MSTTTPSAAASSDAVVRNTLVLVGECEIADSQGRAHRISSITTDRESYIPDVIVKLRDPDRYEDDDLELWDDDVFLKGVIDKLREIGYQGRAFSRGELGAQSSKAVSMEPGDDFCEWVMTKGWRYADGEDVWRANKHLREIPWEAFMTIEASGDRQLGVRLQNMIERHAKETAPRHGNDMERALLDETLPLFREEPAKAAAWVAQHLLQADKDSVAHLIQEVERPSKPKEDPLAEFVRKAEAGDVEINWGKKRNARPR